MTVEARKTATEKEAQNKSRDILNMERESARLEAKKTAAEMEEKQIIDKLWESYELTRSTAPQAAAEIENIGAAQKRVAELKRKISSLGTPNLGKHRFDMAFAYALAFEHKSHLDAPPAVESHFVCFISRLEDTEQCFHHKMLQAFIYHI